MTSGRGPQDDPKQVDPAGINPPDLDLLTTNQRGAAPGRASASGGRPPGDEAAGDEAMGDATWSGSPFGAIAEGARATRRGYREVADVLDALRAPLLVSIIAVIALGFPGQVYEIYRLFAEDFNIREGFAWVQLRFVVFFIALYLLCYTLWYISRAMTLISEACLQALGQIEADGYVARWGPRLIGAAPAFAAAYGMARAESLRAGDVTTPGLYVAAGLAFVIGLIRLYWSWRRTARKEDPYQNVAGSFFRGDVRLLVGLFVVAGVIFFMTMPILFAQRIGTLSTFIFFLIALVYIYAHLTYVYDRYAIPLVALLVGAAFVFSGLDVNDNHFLREREPPPEEAAARIAEAEAALFPPIPVTIGSSFRDWYQARADTAAYARRGEPYPVFVVAAQGGGLYAAFQSAMFLARLQDACPSFATHLFGISGVSGGSVGGAVFAGLAKTYAQNRPINDPSEACARIQGAAQMAPLTRRMLRQDFLTPLISAMLFPDFTARFSPYPIPAFDRARALERTLERSWGVAFDGLNRTRARSGRPPLETPVNPLEEGLLQYWSPDGAAPALFMNTTEAETGRRLVLSPIPDLGDDLRSYQIAVRPRDDGLVPDLRLSTAAIASARFPYVTPAASMPLRSFEGAEGGFEKLRLVDGAYFENSGVDTAMSVIAAIREEAAEMAFQGQLLNGVDIRLIVFDLTEDRFRDATYAFGELLSPIKTILNTTVSRSDLALNRARRALEARCRYVRVADSQIPGASEEDAVSRICAPGAVKDASIWSVSLNDYEYDFQLGWILSDETMSRVEAQLGAADLCVIADDGGSVRLADPEALFAAAQGELPDRVAGSGAGSGADGGRPVEAGLLGDGQTAGQAGSGASGGPTADDAQSAERRREFLERAARRLEAIADDAVATHNSCIGRFAGEVLSAR